MSGNARGRLFGEFMRWMYPAFSRRATQVCILSAALERIERGEADAPAIARAALEQANPFGWKERAAQYQAWEENATLACTREADVCGVTEAGQQTFPAHPPMDPTP